jgi:hypothetical protein
MRRQLTEAAVFALVVLAVGLFSVVLIGQARVTGQPDFKPGKQYHAVYSCHSTPVAPETFINSCFEEYWLTLAVGKNGWLRVMTFGKDLQPTGEYWVNTTTLQAIRELVKPPTTPTSSPHAKPEPGGVAHR